MSKQACWCYIKVDDDEYKEENDAIVTAEQHHAARATHAPCVSAGSHKMLLDRWVRNLDGTGCHGGEGISFRWGLSGVRTADGQVWPAAPSATAA